MSGKTTTKDSQRTLKIFNSIPKTKAIGWNTEKEHKKNYVCPNNGKIIELKEIKRMEKESRGRSQNWFTDCLICNSWDSKHII